MALLCPSAAAAREHPCRPGRANAKPIRRVVAGATHDGGVAVRRERNGCALTGISDRTAADELLALLLPDIAAAGKHPRRSGLVSVGPTAHDRGVAVRGQRDRHPLPGISDRTAADELLALLRPHVAAAGEREGPRGPPRPPASGVAIGRERD